MLGSAYLLGFPPDKLVKMYQNEALRLKGLDSRFIRTGITGDNWRDFLGKKKYTPLISHQLQPLTTEQDTQPHIRTSSTKRYPTTTATGRKS
jgi:hypothetical protein